MTLRVISTIIPNIMKGRTVAALTLGFLVLISPASHAKTLYVDVNTGNDATSWADNGPSNPWRTIGRAAWGSAVKSAPNPSQAARAGDTVVIAAGIYASTLNTGQGRWDILYNPINSGTLGNPITFVANGTVAIHAPSWGGPVVGARFVDYIVWRGPFLIDERFIDTEPDTGPVVFGVTTGSGIDGATIRGTGAIWADNHVGVRFEPCNRCFVRNTTIDNFQSSQSPGSRNGAAVMLYDSDDTLIENNEFFNCGTGIYIKGTLLANPQERTVVRYNIVRNMLSFGVIIKNTTQGRVYQNIISDNPIAIFITGSDGPYDHPVNDVIANNTVDGGGTGIGVMYNGVWDNVALRNNIFASVSRAHASDSSPNPGSASNENSVYFGVTGHFAAFVGGNYSLDTWRISFRQDQVSPASLMADPRFVDIARGDYRLQSSSPARTVGVDILDLDNDGSTTDTVAAGAYVNGGETIGTGAVRPAPPTELTTE